MQNLVTFPPLCVPSRLKIMILIPDLDTALESWFATFGILLFSHGVLSTQGVETDQKATLSSYRTHSNRATLQV